MKEDIIKIAISGILFVIAFIIKVPYSWIKTAIFILSYLIVGLEILKKALKNILKGDAFDENFLMAVATIGAFIVGEYPEAVAVMLFYQIGEVFQDYSVDKSRESIASLINIKPDIANVLRDGKEEKIDPNTVNVGEIVLVKPGEKVPLDGKVIEGESFIDTSCLTGEGVPRRVNIGDEILSGCINTDGLLKIEVTEEYSNSTVNKILELVENASEKKSKSENFITKFAKYYTPIVVIIAIFLAIIPPLIIRNASFSDWIYRALSFLVVSCPCALVISIPLSFFGGIGGAARKGILIKGSNYLEQLAKTEIVVFDKTGTLTKGVFEVQNVNSINIKEEELLEIAATAEYYSNHPIAKSVKKAFNKEIDEGKISNIKEIPGKGIFAKIEGKDVLIGNSTLFEEESIQYEKCEGIGTILYIAIDKKFVGTILIADEIKEDSKKTIKDLKKNGIKQTVMLTGDRKEVSKDVSDKLEIDEVYSELLPDGKVKKVEDLLKNKNEQRKLVFVGDGINDSPVLAMADIGVAMGANGTDSAIEAADIVIMTDEPYKINTAIKIARKNMRIVKENIFFAIFVKVLILFLSAFGISNMWQAVFADVGVSIIATLNSLRMLGKKEMIAK